MGQYHRLVNISKKEFVSPHDLDDGAKLLEMINAQGGVMAALNILLACSNGRGGGDLPDGTTYTGKPGKLRVLKDMSGLGVMPFFKVVADEKLYEMAEKYIGRWAGDQIAIIGDYAEDNDLDPKLPSASVLYGLCHEEKDVKDQIKEYEKDLKDAEPKKKARLTERIALMKKMGPFTNISHDLRVLIEAACNVVFGKDGRKKHPDGSLVEGPMFPDMVIRTK